METAIWSQQGCPTIQSLLLDNMSDLVIMQDEESPNGWTLGDSGDFTIWVHEVHWANPTYLEEELPITIYHEGAHALVGSGHGHDSVWQSAFSCYSS